MSHVIKNYYNCLVLALFISKTPDRNYNVGMNVLTYDTSRGVSGGRAGGVGGPGPASHLTTNRENIHVH